VAKNTLVTLVRDEADVVPGFVTHWAEFIERFVIIDHQSTDSTVSAFRECCKSLGKELHVLTFPYLSYRQDEVMTGVLRHYVRHAHPEDWFFPVDADELLWATTRTELEDALVSSLGLVAFRWRNLAYSGSLWEFDEAGLAAGFDYLDTEDTWSKIALRADWMQRNPDFFVEQGYHAVRSRYAADSLSPPVVGHYAHLPIRSRGRVVKKLFDGTRAYSSVSKVREGQGAHWYSIQDALERDPLNDQVLYRASLHYGHLDFLSRSIDELCHVSSENIWGFRPRSEHGASSASTDDQGPRWRPDPIVPGAIAEAVVLGEEVLLRAAMVSNNGEIIRSPLSRLDHVSIAPVSLNLNEAFRSALQPCDTSIPSTWSGHVPFMRFLVTLIRPRTFVELGTQYGMSFLTGVDAMANAGVECRSVAVDSWLGEEHTGLYDSDVYSFFVERLGKYENASLIRSLFADAIDHFQDGSIDLLHIDGLHTYEAVLRDFSMYLPKMSSRGIVLLHDTRVYERDFGVWRLWEELSEQYPCFDFLHSHGLGVVYVGTDDNDVSRAIGDLRMNPGLLAVVQLAVENVAHACAASANTLALQHAELSTIRSAHLQAAGSLQTIEVELAEVYGSRSWRLMGTARRLRAVFSQRFGG
jgi:hypothetical protein